MRRVVLTVVAALAAAAIAIAATVSSGAASTGATIRITGSGVRDGGSLPFAFSVNAGTPANSVGVYGTFSGVFPHIDGFGVPGPLATFSGVVTCLQATAGRPNTVTYGGIVTVGFGYDFVPGGITPNQRDLAGDFFVTTVQDPAGNQPDTIGSVVWGDRSYYASLGSDYTSFSSVCDNPLTAQGTANQDPLLSGDIHIGPPS